MLAAGSAHAQALTTRSRRVLTELDDGLFGAWDLGNNIVMAWTRDERQYRFLSVRHYAIIESFDAGRPDSSGARA